MKTGYTRKSRYSLVATAKRDGRHLMSVVLGAESKDVRANVSTRMLNKGFEMLATGAAPVVVNSDVPSLPQNINSNSGVKSSGAAAPTFASAYNAARGAIVPKYSTANTSGNAPGNAGVQFGAFSSRASAQSQVQNVLNQIGVNTVIETAPNGMFRVRVNNLSESAAQNIRNRAQNAGIDCYVFH